RLQIRLDLQKRMFRQQQVGRPVSHHDQHTQRVELAGEEAEYINRRNVRPVQIVKEQHQRTQPRDFLQKGGKFALHPLLRSGFDFGQQSSRLFIAIGKRRDLRVPGRRNLLQQVREVWIATALRQTFE